MRHSTNQVLTWDAPKKVIPKDEWKKMSFDGGPDGGYVPNMSWSDRLKWKAKQIGGEDPRVEIRKTFEETGAQVVAIIRWHTKEKSELTISTNGKIGMSFVDWFDFNEAIKEAMEKLM